MVQFKYPAYSFQLYCMSFVRISFSDSCHNYFENFATIFPYSGKQIDLFIWSDFSEYLRVKSSKLVLLLSSCVWVALSFCRNSATLGKRTILRLEHNLELCYHSYQWTCKRFLASISISFMISMIFTLFAYLQNQILSKHKGQPRRLCEVWRYGATNQRDHAWGTVW